MRSEAASRFSSSIGAATAAEARRAPRAATFKENFMVVKRGGEGEKEKNGVGESDRDVNLKKKRRSEREISTQGVLYNSLNCSGQ